jgi:hypothetical protein
MVTIAEYGYALPSVILESNPPFALRMYIVVSP